MTGNTDDVISGINAGLDMMVNCSASLTEDTPETSDRFAIIDDIVDDMLLVSFVAVVSAPNKAQLEARAV